MARPKKNKRGNKKSKTVKKSAAKKSMPVKKSAAKKSKIGRPKIGRPKIGIPKIKNPIVTEIPKPPIIVETPKPPIIVETPKPPIIVETPKPPAISETRQSSISPRIIASQVSSSSPTPSPVLKSNPFEGISDEVKSMAMGMASVLAKRSVITKAEVGAVLKSIPQLQTIPVYSKYGVCIDIYEGGKAVLRLPFNGEYRLAQ